MVDKRDVDGSNLRRPRKVRESKTRDLNTYVEMWRTSYWTLVQAEKEYSGSYFQIMSSLVFTAFTLEAYLNHIGKHVFSYWDDIEQLAPQKKMNIIAEKLGIRMDKGKRPFQTIGDLLKFRNDVAHGKSTTLSSDKVIHALELEDTKYMHEPLEEEWERYCTLDNAKRAREDVEDILKQFHSVSGMNETLFFPGLTGTSGTLLSE